MPPTRRSLLALACLVVLAIAWGCSVLPDNGSPRPSRSREAGCPDGQIDGVLRGIGERLVLNVGGDGPSDMIIHWGAGYDVRRDDGILVVVDPSGRIVAREGDEVVLYGEESSQPGGAWVVCGGFEILSPSRAGGG